jgi:hypothetical protein
VGNLVFGPVAQVTELAKQAKAAKPCSDGVHSCAKRAEELIGNFVFLTLFEKTPQPDLCLVLWRSGKLDSDLQPSPVLRTEPRGLLSKLPKKRSNFWSITWHSPCVVESPLKGIERRNPR